MEAKEKFGELVRLDKLIQEKKLEIVRIDEILKAEKPIMVVTSNGGFLNTGVSSTVKLTNKNIITTAIAKHRLEVADDLMSLEDQFNFLFGTNKVL